MKKSNVFNINIISKTLLTAAAMTSLQVTAAGFQVNVQSASSLANANAGFAANTENVAIIATNPAGAASFDKFAFSVVAAYAEPTVTTTGENSPLTAGYEALNAALINDYAVPDKSDYDIENSVEASTIPSIYAVLPLTDNIALGLAGYTNYGTTTAFPDDYAAGLLGGSTTLKAINFNPSLAFKVGSKLRLGVGAQFVYGTAELKRNLGDAAPAQAIDGIMDAANNSALLLPIVAPIAIATNEVADPALKGSLHGIEAFSMEGDAFGLGWNAGLLLDLNANHKIGVSYRSPVELNFEGDYANYEGVEAEGQLDITLPAMAEFGSYHRFGDLAVQLGVVWTEWSSFEGLEGRSDELGGAVLFEKTYNYEDNMRYSVGLSYYLGESVILRGGYALDEKAGDTTISIPDSQRHWYTTGLTFKLGSTLSIDLTAAYIVGEEEVFEETETNSGLTYAFTNKAEGIVGSAQVNLKF